jgi:sulfite reductase beta subunit-like hemoprotein
MRRMLLAVLAASAVAALPRLLRTIRERRERRRARAAYAARAVELVRERQHLELARGAALEAENARLRQQLAEARDHAGWLAGRVKALEGLRERRDPSMSLKS